ncbi:MAG: hypothetical protein NDJ89_07375 [Oligoflexia bacterium]|nr:hypothetical protein [Oligoflexia bacterium]
MLRFKRKTPFFVAGFTLIGLAFVLAEGRKIPASYESLPAEIAEAANKGREKLGHRISNAFFERISDFDLLDGDLKASRSVFDNNDIEESFTVVDRLRLPVSLTVATLPLGSGFATFNIGLGGSLDVTNLRIVKPSNSLYSKRLLEELLESRDLERRSRELDDSDWLAVARSEFAHASPETPDYYSAPAEKEGEKPVFLLDSLRKARYGRLWNLVASPLRLPLRAEWLSRLEDDEVMTYAGTGLIEVGPSLGLTLQTSSGVLSDLGLNASIRAYLKGEFRVSVMRIGEKRAKVKVTRRVEKGIRGSAGSQTRAEIYDGFLLAGSTLGKIRPSLVPISFSADRAFGRTFEVGYEYDLNDERGIEAYEQAVIGQMGLSDELALATLSDGAAAPVRRAFGRDGEDRRSSRAIGVKLALLKHTGDSTYTVEEATISFPDGTSKVFKARTDALFKRTTGVGIWRSSESARYSIRTDLIENEDGAPGAYGWIAEARIEDNSASGFELNRYASMIESVFGNDRIFPEVPLFLPPDENLNSYRWNEATSANEPAPPEPTRYGYTSFYFRIGLTAAQLRRFATVQPERMWELLELGFERPAGFWTTSGGRAASGVGGWLYNLLGWSTHFTDVDERLGPKFAHARDFQERWAGLAPLAANAGTLEGQRAFARRIGEMYGDKIFAYELIKTTLLALRDLREEEISFQINARSAAFGTRDLRGGTITEIEKLTQRYADETDFDRPILRQDPGLELSRLKAEALEGTGAVKVAFTAARAPGLLMIKLDELSSTLRIATPVRRMLIPNRGGFQAGRNELLLERSEIPGFRRELACALRPGRNYRLTLALIDGGNAGPAQSTEFFVNPVSSGARDGGCPDNSAR